MSRAPEDLLALATCFQIAEDVSVERRGEGLWAVCVLGTCLTATLERCYEPRPSNRTPDFISATRFDRDRAFEIAEAYVASRGA